MTMHNAKQKYNQVKYCIDCNCELLLGDNWTESRKKNGNYICKDCKNKRKRDWAIANPDKAKMSYTKHSRKWRSANPIKAKESSRVSVNK